MTRIYLTMLSISIAKITANEICAQGDCPRVHFFTSLLGGLKDF